MTKLQRSALELSLGAARRDLRNGETAKHVEHQQVNFLRGILVLMINTIDILSRVGDE